MLQATLNAFQWWFANATAAADPLGTSVTPGASNAEGSWTEIAGDADITTDVWLVRININAGHSAGTAKDHLLDIGWDEAGGTSYTARIENIVCGSSGDISSNTGHWHDFPIRIPAGSAVAVRVQGSSGTAGTVRVWAQFFGKPSHPAQAAAGQYAETVGAITNSGGVAFTPGNSGTWGSWVSLGTTTRECWWWQLCVQPSDSNMAAKSYFFDLAWGDGSNKIPIIEKMVGNTILTTEDFSLLPAVNCYAEIPAGATLYVRGVCDGTSETGFTAVAVGIGGG